MPSFKNWDDLRYLIAFYRTGNMAAAAQRLDSNPATVSRRMARLGEALGYPPFEKRPDGWALNPRLERIVEQAIKFDSELINAVSRESEERTGVLAGNVTLCVPYLIGTYMLYPNLVKFMEEYPEIRLSFNLDSLQENLNDNDILMTPVRPQQGRLVAVQTGILKFGIYAHNQTQNAKDWAGLISSHAKNRPMEVALDYYGCEPQVRVDSFQTLHQIAKQTGLSAPLPDFLGDGDNSFSRVEDAPEIADYPLYLCYHETRRSDPVLKVVREWVKECVSDFLRPPSA